jgi:hypothetical protein
MNDDRKRQIVDALNRKYRTSVPVEVVEVAVALGFTDWTALAADYIEGAANAPEAEEPEPGTGYDHWRDMAADTVNHFWFTNREAGVLLAEIDRLRGRVNALLKAGAR